MKPNVFWRWIVLGLALAMTALSAAACGPESVPATQPPDAAARPALLFLFSQP
jgi:hypothetical protein